MKFSVFLDPERLLNDSEMKVLSEPEQWARLKSLVEAAKAGRWEVIREIPWITVLDPCDLGEGGVH